MDKVIYIPAYGLPITKDIVTKVPTGEVKGYWFGIFKKKVTKKVKTSEEIGISDSRVDADRLFSDLSQAVEQCNLEGFEVVSVTPITSGDYNYQVQEGNGLKGHAHKSSYAFGYGYSFTEGLVVIAKKVEEK